MRTHEQLFSKFKGQPRSKRLLRSKFLEAQKAFDKKLRCVERRYKQSEVEKIETLNSNNSTEFWQQVNRLGPRKNSTIPMKVQTDDGISLDHEVIFNKWKNDFKTLYNSELDVGDYDVNFYNACCRNYVLMEAMPENNNIL